MIIFLGDKKLGDNGVGDNGLGDSWLGDNGNRLFYARWKDLA